MPDLPEEKIYPQLAVTQPKYDKPLTWYGTAYKKYLQETQPGQYAILMGTLELMKVCHQKEDEANRYEGVVLERLRKQNPPPRTEDTTKMIQYNNALYRQAKEITMNDVVYQK